MSSSLWPHGPWPTRLFCPWDFLPRILEWVAIPFSRGSSQPRDRTWVSCLVGRFFAIWATREALVKEVFYMDVRVGLWSWVPKNWCFWTMVLEKTLESPLDCKEIQPVHSEGDQSWVFFGRIDAEAETPKLWPPDAKSWLIGKDSDAGRDWGQEGKETTEDETAGWHHRLDGHEFGWTPGVGDGQGGLACSNSWDCKESDTTEWLNWTELSPNQIT